MKDDPIPNAIRDLWQKHIFMHDERRISVACLLRSADYRPLKASWWRGKEVYIMGADLDGNFILRHSDGSVRLWDHALQSDLVLAPSIRDFVSQLKEQDGES